MIHMIIQSSKLKVFKSRIPPFKYVTHVPSGESCNPLGAEPTKAGDAQKRSILRSSRWSAGGAGAIWDADSAEAAFWALVLSEFALADWAAPCPGTTSLKFAMVEE